MTKRREAQRIGRIGEKWAWRELRHRGYDAEMVSYFFTQNCDLKINRLPVEVKLAYPTYRKPHPDGPWRPRWQFHIPPTAMNMASEWLLILIAVDSSGFKHWYIIPGSLVNNRPHLQITSHPNKYAGWMAYYKSNWKIIDALLCKDYQKMIEWERAAA